MSRNVASKVFREVGSHGSHTDPKCFNPSFTRESLMFSLVFVASAAAVECHRLLQLKKS